MRISIVTASIAAFLAGCATTPAEQAAQKAQKKAQEADRMAVVYGPACEKLGFERDTDPWRNCVIGLSQKDAIARYSNNAFDSPPFDSPPFDSPPFDSPPLDSPAEGPPYYGPPFFHQPYWVR
jgi:hypothetical protein